MSTVICTGSHSQARAVRDIAGGYQCGAWLRTLFMRCVIIGVSLEVAAIVEAFVMRGRTAVGVAIDELRGGVNV
eukprot:scaffold90639_cov66-Phaeocystis_antarctica.AAC.9